MKLKLDTKPLIIAHRGASGYEPENTLRACKRALEMGVHAIELDVHTAKSGELVVIHDDTIDRTTNGTGAVTEFTYQELQQYDAGEGEQIPTLAQVLELINKEALVNLDLKSLSAAQPLAELIKRYVTKKQWSYDNFVVTAFDYDTVMEFHTHCPQVPIGIIFEKNLTGSIDTVQQAAAQCAVVPYQSVTQELVDEAHELGIAIFAYTVNNRSIAQRLVKLDVDAIIADYPDILD